MIRKQGRYQKKDNTAELIANMENYLFFTRYYFDGLEIQVNDIDDVLIKRSIKTVVKRLVKNLDLLDNILKYHEETKIGGENSGEEK